MKLFFYYFFLPRLVTTVHADMLILTDLQKLPLTSVKNFPLLFTDSVLYIMLMLAPVLHWLSTLISLC